MIEDGRADALIGRPSAAAVFTDVELLSSIKCSVHIRQNVVRPNGVGLDKTVPFCGNRAGEHFDTAFAAVYGATVGRAGPAGSELILMILPPLLRAIIRCCRRAGTPEMRWSG